MINIKNNSIWWIILVFSLFISLFFASLFIGISSITLIDLLLLDGFAWDILLATRIPRTVALILSGSSLAIAGVIFQSLTQNKFVEPNTSGTTAAAALGLLITLIFFPDITILGRILVTTICALIGAFSFLIILQNLPLKNALVVPLVGIIFTSILNSIATFIGYKFNLLQSLLAWKTGDFALILAGRYELIWLTAIVCIFAYLFAHKFTIAGLGRNITEGLGVNYRVTVTLGIIMVSIISALTMTIVGSIPFVGLVIPNFVSLLLGDNLKKSLPIVALSGAILLLICDILGRIIDYPYEIPIGTMMGVIGSGLFLIIILSQKKHVG
ncbi:ABC transporter permease [Bartonella sp. DGB1]|uniref:ABC transporter permease n=1 Tax=Bartonella sp. DGB1 TaxID=3239807 RepID=UPI003526C130